MAFRGTYDHTLDAKFRLTVPSKFRAAFADGVVLVKSPPGCVQMWPAEVYSTRAEAALAGLNPFHPETQQLARLLWANAFDAELDSASRIIVPPDCRTHANLTKQVVVTGVGQYAELWDREQWQTYNASLTASAPELTASFGRSA